MSTRHALLLSTVLALAGACASSKPASQSTPAAAPAPAPAAATGAEHEHGHAAAPAAGAAVVPPGEAKVGDTTKCPVTGESFVVKADSPSYVHEGKTYYFCCAGCIGRFKAEPKKYLGAQP